MTYPIRVRTSALIIQDNKVLLVEFKDENGLHYNLPGGGVESGETLVESVKREALEEASVHIEVGSVAFLYEYAPFKNKEKYGTVHSLTTVFDCKLRDGEIPQLPHNPDENQTAVKWILLDELNNVVLYPNIRHHILLHVKQHRSIDLLEEQKLEGYK
ncbi:NUDIX domain-containing protein [Metabacillus fastidiosus]|uniref:NUDIX domain-containing protein n=1 Tax=Metabacillus fastidiosus TaxID=1458 RepID=UPI002E1FB55E|nr:NUDIX domain-containing protein [Metabacillus fastidiosus]MED4453819.1 NUDIX domain-containing protein [Metabacillus fastidiosus]